MQIILTNVSDSQYTALRSNFDSITANTSKDDPFKYDVTINFESEIDFWKLFFSGADYTLARFGRVKV